MVKLMDYVVFYLIAVNLFGAFLTAYDKIAAIKGKWRISERSLFLFAFIGGATLMYLTMKLIRHKTLKRKFMIGFPLIACLHVAVLYGVISVLA